MTETNAQISDVTIIDKQIETLKTVIRGLSELSSILNDELRVAKDTWTDAKYDDFAQIIYDILDEIVFPVIRLNGNVRKLTELKTIILEYLK